jgi:ABC-2 type transport system permease protein
MSTELAPNPTRWSPTQTRAQFSAIAWLRWRIFVNSFRRKGGTGELISRIIIFPLFAMIALLPTAGVGAGAFYFAHTGQLNRLFWLLWITFGLCQLLNIQLGQPGTTFNPTLLIRFPMRLGSFTAVRLFFGVLTPANIIGTLMSFSIALGITIARPALWAYAFLALAVFAAANVLFSRMIFAWVDRWLSTRRAREIFTGLIFAFSLGIQWLNFTFNPAYNRHHGHTRSITPDRISAAAHLYQRAQPILAALPPGLTGNSLVAANHGQPLNFLAYTAGCALYAAAFLAVFMLRMRTEYRGENLSDVANAVRTSKKASAATTKPTPATLTSIAPAGTINRRAFLPPIVSTMLAKEFLYIRRNTGIFYSLIAPLFFVFLFSVKMSTRFHSPWVFPAAVAYTMLGITPLAYNSFGLEGTGSQFYFLVPVNLRDVFLAKNLMNFLLSFLEIAAVFAIISYSAAIPPLHIIAASILWAAATLLLSTMLGNHRSISAPKKVNIARAGRKQASGLSALIGMGVLLLSATIGAGLFLLATIFHKNWLLVPLFAIFAATALWFYLSSLRTIDTFARSHREDLFLELCKKD